jgi:Protein of unknown function (DUF998)
VSVGLSPGDVQQQLSSISAPSARTRRFAGLAIFFVLLGAGLLALLDVVSMRMNPLSEPISNYALTRYGWMFDLAVIALALGLATLLCAFIVADVVELGSGAFVVTAICCLCLVLVVVFPDQSSAGGLSAGGWAHWASAMVAFGGLLVTPVVLGGRHRSSSGSDASGGVGTAWLRLHPRGFGGPDWIFSCWVRTMARRRG